MKPGGIAVVFLLTAAFYGLDHELAALEAREVAGQARGLHQKGKAALASGDAKTAVDLLLRAHALERDDRGYQLALAEAQRKAGRLEDARDSLAQLLTEDSNDADANLEMARAMAAQQDYGKAASFYHRALFGDGMKDPLQVRLELAELLARHGTRQELLAELLLLQSPASTDPAVARKVAGLFLQADASDRAADLYRALLRIDPADRAARAGLANVALARGDYRAAEAGFARVGDEQKRSLAETLSELDPTVRRLSSAEKYRRSLQILQMTAAACGQTVDRKPETPSNEGAEALLEQATGMWTGGNCKAGENSPLPLLQQKLAQ